MTLYAWSYQSGVAFYYKNDSKRTLLHKLTFQLQNLRGVDFDANQPTDIVLVGGQTKLIKLEKINQAENYRFAYSCSGKFQ